MASCWRFSLLMTLMFCPVTLLAGSATVFYYTPARDWQTVFMHHDARSAGAEPSWTTAPGEVMQPACTHWVSRTIDLGSRSSFQAVFTNGSGSWDNPNGQPGSNYLLTAGINRVSNGQRLASQTSPCPAPLPPAGLQAAAGGISASSIRLQWSASSGVIQRYGISQNGVYVGSSTGTSYTVNGLQPLTTYAFAVYAEDNAGQRSPWSAPVQITTSSPDTVPPQPPEGLRLSNATSTSLKLSWQPATDPSGIRGYGVWRGKTLIARTRSTSVTDKNLQPSTRYSYTVVAQDEAGNTSARSTAISGSTLPAGPLLADTPTLKTWWHNRAEANENTPVADDHVRQSTRYTVKVASAAAPASRYDAFVYMSIPRGGREKWGYVTPDGAEYAKAAGWTMSWASFLYGADAVVDVSLPAGSTLASASEVTIRPRVTGLRTELLDNRTVRIHVPWDPAGLRFSVEFAQHLHGSYHTPAGQLSTSASGNVLVHEAPRHALMIFAEPMISAAEQARLVPGPTSGSIHYPTPGQINQLDSVTDAVIYFRAGTYYMPWNYRASLSPQVRWIYLEPGAYIKGAFQIPAGQADFRITGYGVLSGEKYVYEADTANGYQHRAPDSSNCWGTCVKMLQFAAGPGEQTLTLHGLTINEPPYHSFVAYGDEQRFHMDVSHYKQVGGWYWQTDGLELYPGSTLRHAFFHANDDVIKIYHSGVRVQDVVVWKGENGPVVQWGWKPRTVDDVQINGLYVIHNFMHWSGVHNLCVINSARSYLDDQSTRLGDPQQLISNITLENIYVEGKTACALRLNAMSGWRNITVRNLFIDGWNGLDTNTFQAMSNAAGTPVVIGNEMRDGLGLLIDNMTVAGERILKSGNNWQSYQSGRLNFDGALWESWNAR